MEAKEHIEKLFEKHTKSLRKIVLLEMLIEAIDEDFSVFIFLFNKVNFTKEELELFQLILKIAEGYHEEIGSSC